MPRGHPVTTRPLEGGWAWLVRPNPLMLRHDVEPLVMSVWDLFIARLVLLLGRAPQFLYLPSDFRRDSPRTPAFFPGSGGPSCFPAKLPSHRLLPPPATVPLAWCYGGGTAVPRCWSHVGRPTWDQPATAKLPASQQRASHPLTSPSSKRAGNTSLRPAGADPVGPTGEAAKEGRGGDFRERPSGHVPRHPSQSRPRQGFPDSPFWLRPRFRDVARN